jgi:hypothetical protein
MAAASDPAATSAAGEVVLVSAMRNEAPFILEWVAYHRAIGIDHVVICSNGSDDGSDELLAALDAAGFIRFIPTRPAPKVGPQTEAVRAFENSVGYQDGTWYLWLDADEFLNVHVGDRSIRALVAAVGKASAMMLNWRLFGANGNRTFPGRYISEAFTGASRRRFAANFETKPLFRRGDKFCGFAANAVGLPRLAPSAKVTLADCLGGNGRPLDPSSPRTEPWLSGQPFVGRNNLATRREVGWDIAQINHYSVRTPDHFQLKASRGRGTVATGPRRPNTRHTPQYFRRFNRNETEDRSILFWEAAVTEGINRLLAVPEVAAASRDADRRMGLLLESGFLDASGRPESGDDEWVEGRGFA